MKKFQRLLTMLLALCLVVGMIPATASATENPDVTADSGDMTFESTNSFGYMLSQDLQEEQAQDEEQSAGGYTVLGLTIEGNTAMVEYSSLEEAVLVVALYTEDGLQMLNSGKTTVDPEATEAIVTIEGDVPEYFMAAAYLVDIYDYSPLCEAYSTPMYTKEMQELLASTVDDYDEDLVLNFDEDETTNFAVFVEGVKIIDYAEGVNTVISADDENATYVLGNADSNITSLQPGDILAYTYGEEQLLIVKVASIELDGTTATIIGEDTEMEEVFSHVKMEQSGDARDIEVDESTCPENVVYEGKTSDGPSTYAMLAVEGEGGHETFMNFKFIKPKKDNVDTTIGTVGVTGTVGFGLKIEFDYYVSLKRQFIEFSIDVGLKASFKFEGKLKKEIPLPKLKFKIVALGIGFEPEFQFEAEAGVEVSFFAGWTIGFSVENKKFQNLTSKPKVEAEFKIQGSIYIALDLAPTIEIAEGAIAEGKIEAPMGIEVSAKLKGTDFEPASSNAEIIHDCKKCVEMELKFKGEISEKITFLKMKKLEYSSKAIKISAKLKDMYWSIDRGEFHFTKCPHRSYRVSVYVAEMTDKKQCIPVANTAVEAKQKSGAYCMSMGTTNKNGVVVSYLQPGTYTISATVKGEKLERTIVVKEACQINLNEGTVKALNVPVNGAINPDLITDNGIVVAKGNCGAEGDNVTWKLYSNGLLKIEGTGEMKDYIGSDPDKAPWNTFRSKILKINITDGVTRIGSDAFYGCSSLSSINIPKGITSIGYSAFYGCSSLCSINIPNGITSIGDMVFAHCSGLSSINIPEGVTSIGECAFIECNSLTSITLPESVTYIDWGAFFLCSSLSSINIPEGVTSIGEFAFACCDSLSSITIPKSVTNIGEAAFCNCTSLSSITIPKGIASIERETFFGCASLTSITIPESVTSIGDSAFENCSNLADIYYGGNKEQWDNISIGSSNTELTKATIHFADDTISAEAATLAAREENAEISISELQDIQFEQENSTLDAVFGGEYSTVGTQKTASFSGLVPGAQYVLLAMASIETEDVLDAENLLYISQKAAEEDGTLVFTYVQRINTDTSYVVACGASNKNLQDAVITFPEMNPTGELQIVNPMVTYDGEELTAGVDYVVVGQTDFTEIGDYTCRIRGIRNYTGLVECSYSVTEAVKVTNITLNQTELAMEPGDAVQLTATVMPENASNANVIWTSSNSEIASVDESGLVTAVADGSAIITAIAADGSGFDASCAVTVTSYVELPYPSIIAGEEQLVTILEGGEQAYFAFTPAYTERYSFYSVGEADTVGSIYDSEMNYLASDDDSGEGSNFSIIRTLEAGKTYILRASYISEMETGSFSVMVKTEPIGKEGICGDNLTWVLDDAGTLTISGTGEMYDYYFDPAPWGEWRAFIKQIVIQPGATNISGGAFFNYDSLVSITIADSVTQIGAEAFYECDGIANIEFPASLTSIRGYAFSYCSNLSEISFAGDAPEITDDSFENVTANAYYPAGNETWTEEVMQNYGGTITWVAQYEKPAYILGDVNSDGVVNAHDRVYLARYLAKWTDYPASVINMDAADVNGDGAVNAHDRVYLARHLAKWTGYETLGA